MGESSKLIVMTSGDRCIDEVKKQLTDNGFVVEEVLDELGFITGKVTDKNVVDRLRAIPGVTHISEEPPPINIGPPGESETW